MTDHHYEHVKLKPGPTVKVKYKRAGKLPPRSIWSEQDDKSDDRILRKALSIPMPIEETELTDDTNGIKARCIHPAHLCGAIRWIYPAATPGRWNAFFYPGDHAGRVEGDAADYLEHLPEERAFVGNEGLLRYEVCDGSDIGRVR